MRCSLTSHGALTTQTKIASDHDFVYAFFDTPLVAHVHYDLVNSGNYDFRCAQADLEQNSPQPRPACSGLTSAPAPRRRHPERVSAIKNGLSARISRDWRTD